MKLRVLTLLSVFAVTLGVRAAQSAFYDKFGFESPLVINSELNPKADDSGAETQYTWWISARIDEPTKQAGVVKSYGSETAYEYPDSEATALVKPGHGTQYVELNASVNPLYRTNNFSDGVHEPDELTQIGGGFIVDTLVKLSYRDEDEVDLEELKADYGELFRPKVLVWQNPSTNLIATAASIGETIDAIAPKNFVLADESGAELELGTNDWHRLTIRLFDDITSDNQKIAGVDIFVDEKPVKCAEASATDYETAFGGFLKDRLNPTASALYAEKRLFISLVPGGTKTAQTFMAAGFNGCGKIDDLSTVSLAEAPAFAQGGTWTLKWTEGVTGFKLNGEAVSIEGGAKEIAFTGASDTAEITEVTYAEGYAAGTWTTEGGATLDNDTFTITAANAVCTIVANLEAVGRFTVGDKSYSLLSEVFADLGSEPITIELTDDFSTALETGMEEGYLIGSDMPAITLDIKGHTITKEGISGVLFTINEECKGFTLIDTVGGGKLVGDAEGLFNISGLMTIGNLEGDKGVTIETVLTDKFGASEDLTIVNGAFKDPNNTTSTGAFSYVDNLAKGRGCELVKLEELEDDYYWTITQGGTYKLEWTEGVASFKANGTPMEVTEAGGVVFSFVGESTTLEITEVVYAENYRQGAWIAEGGATLSEATFTIVSGAEDPVCVIVAEVIPPLPASVNFTATFGEGVESAKLMKGDELIEELVAGEPVEVDFETTYTIEPTLKPWYVDATISTSEGITPDGLSFTVDAGAEAASATISATNAKDSARSASELAGLLGITENPEAIANDTRFKAIAIWAQGKGYLPMKLNDAGFNREYLLNGFDGVLRITSIAVDSTTGVITIGKPEWDFNGVLHVQGKALLTDGEWDDCTEPITTADGYNFFRLELRFE